MAFVSECGRQGRKLMVIPLPRSEGGGEKCEN